LLIDLPRGVVLPDFLNEIRKSTGKPVRSFVRTHILPSDRELFEALVKQGLRELPWSTETILEPGRQSRFPQVPQRAASSTTVIVLLEPRYRRFRKKRNRHALPVALRCFAA
jgi:hypothetical protein